MSSWESFLYALLYAYVFMGFGYLVAKMIRRRSK